MSVKFTKLKVELEQEDCSTVNNGLASVVVESDVESDVLSDDDQKVQLLMVGEHGKNRWSLSSWKYRLKRSKLCKSCKCCRVNSWKALVIAVVVFITAIGITFLISRLASEPPPPVGMGAVATDVPVCSDMAAAILRKNGSAVDAAITALLCVGAVSAESSGIGGGGFMVVRASNGSMSAINFRESAPATAFAEMFHSNKTLAEIGSLSVAVPGELRGMEMAHRLFGRLKWAQLFDPVIVMCREGFEMTKHSERAVEVKWPLLSGSELFRSIYLRNNGTLKQAGDVIKRPLLADTLEEVAKQGAGVFYTGSIAKSIVEAMGGSGALTLDDLESYEAKPEETVSVNYNGYTIHSPPLPSGGPSFLFSLAVMNGYQLPANGTLTTLTAHRLVEVLKYAFALRTQLGDPACGGDASCDELRSSVLETQANLTSESYAAYIRAQISDTQTYNISHYHAHFSSPVDAGTTHVSALDPSGQAVSVTSSVNTYFGSTLITSTGIVLNNNMDDFSAPNAFGLPPSVANYVAPGKRPLSSTCPSIVLKPNSTEAHLIIGGAGGTRIPTSTAQAVLRVLSFKEPLSEAIEARRLHHQLAPNVVYLEDGFPNATAEYLEGLGHVTAPDPHFAVVQGVLVDGDITAHSDSRKLGQAVVTPVT